MARVFKWKPVLTSPDYGNCRDLSPDGFQASCQVATPSGCFQIGINGKDLYNQLCASVGEERPSTDFSSLAAACEDSCSSNQMDIGCDSDSDDSDSHVPDDDSVPVTDRQTLEERFGQFEKSHTDVVSDLRSLYNSQLRLISEKVTACHKDLPQWSLHLRVYERRLAAKLTQVTHDKLQRSCVGGTTRDRKRSLSTVAIRIMKKWYSKNRDHPYPTSQVIQLIATAGDVSTEQVRKWFANRRMRDQPK